MSKTREKGNDNYVVAEKHNEEEIGKYAVEGKDKLWLQKSHYYDADFGPLVHSDHRSAVWPHVTLCSECQRCRPGS